jgi:hypothetical protein
MFVLLQAHSGVRYLVLLAGLLVVLYALFGLVTRRPFDRTMRILGAAFAGTLHLQVLLGIVLLFTGRFAAGMGPHIITMIFAAAVAQIVPSVMRRRPPQQRTWGPYLVGGLVSLALVVTGVVALGRRIVG